MRQSGEKHTIFVTYARIVIPEWDAAFRELTEWDNEDYLPLTERMMGSCGSDYVAKICDYAIGIQIIPVTTTANFGSYSLTERM